MTASCIAVMLPRGQNLPTDIETTGKRLKIAYVVVHTQNDSQSENNAGLLSWLVKKGRIIFWD